MKAVLVFSAIVACALANGYGGSSYGGGYDSGHSYAAPIVSKVINVNTGHSTQYRRQSGWDYAFGYDAAWTDGAWGRGAHSRHETGDGWGNKQGSYSLNIGDGRSRLVKYVADGAGFRASIKTNEPGIVASNLAAVNINTPHGYAQASYSAPAATVTHVGGYTSQGGYGGDSYGASGY